jgi:hypothetical protein
LYATKIEVSLAGKKKEDKSTDCREGAFGRSLCDHEQPVNGEPVKDVLDPVVFSWQPVITN